MIANLKKTFFSPNSIMSKRTYKQNIFFSGSNNLVKFSISVTYGILISFLTVDLFSAAYKTANERTNFLTLHLHFVLVFAKSEMKIVPYRFRKSRIMIE